MRLIHIPGGVGIPVVAALPAAARTLSVGGDVHAGGDVAGSRAQGERDLFAAGPAAAFLAPILWTHGCLLRAYVAALFPLEVLRTSTTPRGLGTRLLALGLVIAAVLNFLPLPGWMANPATGFPGIGAIALTSADLTGRLSNARPGKAR
ncbi:hypothetical protein [Paracoccus benzoatiresistens]|uniref:Uncharacterized protein n=1 Tax=Paracoccus benzoatiresistens TaxID=2997341 RepID=A0ABT4JA07_9RHOB|nr:hypothetical protein [Paracoccus sp. EF6]MCZ0963744.1 hypothetical protein [Paracoccus sp. EF6]